MFFFLSKTLPLFIYPIGLVCILLIVAVFLWRRRGWQTAVLLTAFFLLYLAANPLVSLWLARSLEWRYLPPDPLPQVDVIVVLGGSTTIAGYPQTTVGLNDAADRLWYAAWLYHEGAADRLLLTGGKLPGNAISEAERMAEALRLMGVPDEAMLLEAESMNTYENAVFSKTMLQAHDMETVLLVTSAIHMPRSVAIFTKQGIEVIPAPTDYEFVQPDWEEGENAGWFYWGLSLLPDADALELTTSGLKEYVGILIYRLRGWL
ncbi:MAG TPA: YdcF family protein [Chloroflexota bacterium]|nr:YdcF family protein [Chloroflexota bacterium]HUM69947.1 YdcF family protein [Chloroflexota bacterium]